MSDDRDIDVRIDVKKGRVRAMVTAWAAGVAAIIGAAGAAIWVIGKASFAVIALLLNYEEVNFGEVSAKKHPLPRIERQNADNNGPQVVQPEMKLEGGLREKPPTKVEPRGGDSGKVGKPIDLRPKIVDGGTVLRIEPAEQGDSDDGNPERPPEEAFEEGGRWYVKRPFKCRTLGGLPMPYEACSVSPISPGGRPTIRQ